MKTKPTPVTLAMKNPELARSLEDLVRSFPGFVPVAVNGVTPEGLLIYEIGKDDEKDLSKLLRMLGEKPAEEVAITAADPKPDLLIRAMRAGIKDFLPQPIQSEDVSQALRRYKLYVANAAKVRPMKLGNVVTLVGSKGGIGTSSLAVNLAYELNGASSRSASLIDMRNPLGDIPLFLDLEYSYTWGEVARNLNRLDATFLKGIMSVHSSGLSVLPSPGAGHEDVVMNREVIEGLFNVLKEAFTHTVVDADSGFDDVTLKVLDMSDVVLLVLVLSLPCLANAKKLMETYRRIDVTLGDKIKLVINRHLSGSDISVSEAEEIMGQEILWQIPNDYQTTLSAINQGAALAEVAPKSPVTRAIGGLARHLAKVPKVPEAKKGTFLNKVFRKTQPAAQA